MNKSHHKTRFEINKSCNKDNIQKKNSYQLNTILIKLRFINII